MNYTLSYLQRLCLSFIIALAFLLACGKNEDHQKTSQTPDNSDPSPVESSLGASTPANESTSSADSNPPLPWNAMQRISSERSGSVGWNQLALPLTTATAVETFLKNYPAILSLWKWDTALRTWYVFPKRANYPLLTEVTPDDGYWVESAGSLNFGNTGKSKNNYNISEGWNFLAYSPALKTVDVSTYISSDLFNINSCGRWEIQSVWLWTGTSWKIYFNDANELNQFNQLQGSNYNKLSSIEPGMALWVNAVRSLRSNAPQGCSQISLGDDHSCVLLPNGTVKCWGVGSSGQLGNGSLSSVTTPKTVVGISGVSQINSGAYHTCTVNAVGTIRCWGLGTSGQLGNNQLLTQSLPVTVEGISNAAQVGVGFTHTCAVLKSGLVQCWGDNSSAQLGNGSTTASLIPVAVSNLSTVTQVALGDLHTCAVQGNGTVTCWGASSFGQLGSRATSVYQATPVAVLSLTKVSQISAGSFHNCALNSLGKVSCWGRGNLGQLGNGLDDVRNNNTAYQSNVPVEVKLNNLAIHITSGNNHNCALINDGSVQCWGDGSLGQLGDGNSQSASSPVTVVGISSAVSISAGKEHTCALLASGAAQCWGNGLNGRLGTGENLASNVPLVTANLNSVSSMSSGLNSNCALLQDSSVQCWGKGGEGQIGNGSLNDQALPVRALLSGKAVQISAKKLHVCALLANASIECWGNGSYGQLGQGFALSSSKPEQTQQLNAPIQVAVGADHTCALLGSSSGKVQCWGRGDNGELGNSFPSNPNAGLSYSSVFPMDTTSSSLTLEIAVGANHTCTRLSSGAVQCWGKNNLGQLGNTTAVNSSAPQAVTGLTLASQISLGNEHSCALQSNGNVACWGKGTDGQIGHSSFSNTSSFALVSSLALATQISAGGNHNCAVLQSGVVKCWGRNEFGQLGDGTTTSASVPVTVISITNAKSVSLGENHSCAILKDSTISCWGYRELGQLGDGLSLSNRPLAVQNLGLDAANAVTITKPNTPADLSATADSPTALRLSWSAVSGADYYRIYRFIGGSYNLIANDVTATQYLHTGLTNGVIYYYKVSAVNGGGESDLSAFISGSTKVPSTDAVGVPINLAVTKLSTSSLQISWNALSGAVSYNLYRFVLGEYQLIQAKLSTTSYTDTALNASTEYFYRVSAVNTVGEGILSNPVSGSTQ